MNHNTSDLTLSPRKGRGWNDSNAGTEQDWAPPQWCSTPAEGATAAAFLLSKPKHQLPKYKTITQLSTNTQVRLVQMQRQTDANGAHARADTEANDSP